MTTAIRAAVLDAAKEDFVFKDLVLDDPRPDEVLVKISAVGLCHTDLSVQQGYMPAAFPFVLGHEGSGIVEKVGEGVTDIKVGDAVALSFAACGHCRNCLDGRPAYCLSFIPQNLGGVREDGSVTMHDADGNDVHGSFFGQSSFATYALAAAHNVVVLPEGAPVEISGPLGCGIQTGAGTVLNSLDVKPGTSVVVSGTGAVGLSGIMGAKVAGATTIIAVDIIDERLEFAKKLGATHVINSKNEDPVERIKEITGDGADYAMDTTAVPAVISQIFEATSFGAKVALVGVGKPDAEIAVALLSGKTVFGAMEGDSIPRNFIPQLVELYKAGQFPFDELVTTYPFEDLDRAIADTASGKSVKAVLVMSDQD